MNDAHPRWHYAEGGPDDERDPYPQGPYHQQQHYGYDAYGRPAQPPYPPQDPAYGGGQQGWIPQQPQAPYQDQGYDTGPEPVYDTGQQPLYDTGQHAVYDTGRQQVHYEQTATVPPQRPAPPDYHTEQFAFVDEESDQSEEVIDWLKFSESRTERREEAKRRSRNRKAGLVVLLVLAMLGGAGYLYREGRIPGLGTSKAAPEAASGAQRRDVIVVHLLPVNGGPSATALLVDNTTKGRGTTVLVPGTLNLTTDDGTPTTLAKSVADGVGPTRDSLNTLLGADIKGSWRLDSPYLELLVDALGDVFVDTDTAVKGTGKDRGKTLVPRGTQQELTGQAAVAYATYKAPGEPQTKQLSRFGQVMQAVLKKMPSDALSATKTVQSLSQILDPSLTDKQLGASLAQLANLAKTGAYDTTMLPVRADGTLTAQATDSVVKNVLGGAVKQSANAGQPRIEIKDATGTLRAASIAQAAIVNGGTYTYVPGGKAPATRAVSQVLYADPGKLAAAKDVAATLGLDAGAVRKGAVPPNADVLVLLGRDYKVPAAR